MIKITRSLEPQLLDDGTLIIATDLLPQVKRVIVEQDKKCSVFYMDGVEVVRCRDCKWYTEGINECEEWQGCGNLGIHLPHENWFCAYGERREDERNI